MRTNDAVTEMARDWFARRDADLRARGIDPDQIPDGVMFCAPEYKQMMEEVLAKKRKGKKGY